MGANQLLVDTDVLIAYLNSRRYRSYLENHKFKIFYSAISKKELFAKRGLKGSEKQGIITVLRRFRLALVDQRVIAEYSRLRLSHPQLEKGDALIAATALARRLPLLTQNLRHFRIVKSPILLPIEAR